LTHLDENGDASMVDVSAKVVTQRIAVAQGRVKMLPATLAMITDCTNKKGDVFAVARVAGIQAAKKCSELIPLCHPIMLNSVKVDLHSDELANEVVITATCKISAQTGVEMEALTAVSVAGLTVYDMCKAVDKGMVISAVQLLEKRGGRSGDWNIEL
jgi:cyclic pyranopterin phosphate synthase